jgi:hypothetical protein
VRALLELEGRLAEALPVRPLVPAVGLLLEGRLPTVGLLVLVRPEALAVELPAVGRLVDALLPTLALVLPLALPDMLPPVVALPPSCRLWLIEPAVPLL